MGVDSIAAVDDQLRVRGLAGLRVADASIMPTLTSGKHQRAVYHDRCEGRADDAGIDRSSRRGMSESADADAATRTAFRLIGPRTGCRIAQHGVADKKAQIVCRLTCGYGSQDISGVAVCRSRHDLTSAIENSAPAAFPLAHVSNRSSYSPTSSSPQSRANGGEEGIRTLDAGLPRITGLAKRASSAIPTRGFHRLASG